MNGVKKSLLNTDESHLIIDCTNLESFNIFLWLCLFIVKLIYIDIFLEIYFFEIGGQLNGQKSLERSLLPI
ncbi:hypothetical protein GCM10020331_069800 [Ectobacillus funiculus]